MKAIKLILIFLLLVAGIFLAMNWGTLVQSVKGEDTSFVEDDLIDIGEKCDDIRASWKAQMGWNQETYQLQREDIEQSRAMGLFSLEGYNTVNNCLRETSVNKACNGYVDALHTKPFNEKELQRQLNGVRFLKEKELLKNDVRVQRVEQLSQLYNRIRQFAGGGHVIVPCFDTETCTWVSFAGRQNQVLTTARSLRQHTLFKEMEEVPGFREALNEERLKKVTESQRSTFYQRLSAQIVNHFNSLEVTPDNWNVLSRVYKTFAKEEKGSGLGELAEVMVDFKEELDQLTNKGNSL